MYDDYDGLIFDMDGTILNTEPTHLLAWRRVLVQYRLDFEEKALVGLSGSPAWRIAQAILIHNQSDLDPHQLAAEKRDY